MRYTHYFLSILIIGMILISGCITIYAPSGPQSSSQDPLVGEWQMTRTGISPAIPLPDLIINQLISDKATWKITRESNGQLKIAYDGRDTWYKTLGISADKKSTTANEAASHSSCTFISSGGIYVDKVPSFPGITQRIEQVSITYDDSVQTVLSSASKIAATITVNVQGKYYGEMEIGGMKWKPIDSYRATITYEGTKK